MKQVIISFALSWVLFFIDIEINIAWYHLFVDGHRILSSTLEWLQWHLLLATPPSMAVYFIVGWFSHCLYFKHQHVNILIFSGFIMMWRLIFITHIWFEEPSIADIVWTSIIEIIPSVFVLLGFHAYSYRLRNKNDK